MIQKGGLLTLHLYDFRAELGGVLPLKELIQGNYARKLKVSLEEYTKLLSLLKNRDIEARFHESAARLYIPPFQNTPSYLVDREARVKMDQSEYLLSPWYFLQLVDYLEYIQFKNGITTGIPKVHLRK